jgi:2-C-methyl-D-erythritol 4-phosphate cytidylyltransferase
MPDIYALIPAAGSGVRMGAAIPKQYQLLAERPLLAHAVEALATHAAVRREFVVIAPGDTRYADIVWREGVAGRITALPCGGATRAQSVSNGLSAIDNAVRAEDWVMVHDAARPCLTHGLIDDLVRGARAHATGALLAIPVADTLKRANAAREAEATVPRDALWQAQTPQMFRHGELLNALRRAGDAVTDEAGAMELAGVKPLLVPGSPRNLKVTHPHDMAMAEIILKTAP